ncbi:HEAT repeat domain-containing protein [uncultured Treponema sp.]|uniref:HEAT repeat domain-containing protein n=1 Tax=uncultured Treponema sp. TaxID=162155 RepID=UPI002591B771|nr:HEAT repeat domain-containing protein [uncultured Treponema sp.]
MKNIFFILIFVVSAVHVYAQELPATPSEQTVDSSFEQIERTASDVTEQTVQPKKEDAEFKYKIEKIYPEPKRPSVKSESFLAQADESDSYVKECSDTFRYGLEEDIATLLDELTKNDDLRFVDPIYDLFQSTKSPSIRNKILAYFTKLKDPCLADYAVAVINDPYDEKKDTVDACFKYVAAAGCTEAVPGLVDLVDKEEERYFNGALSALGDLGGREEALFLSSYIDRDDLTVAQRQSLMRVLGKIKAVETWDKLSEIAQDEDENSFVRMYAAEAIGAMEKSESEDILLDLFESDDPNFRVYVLKGMSYFHDSKADALVMQALRDSQYKVRLEAVESAGKRDMKEAVPYLIYRCRDKNEQKAVKDKCYKEIARLNTKEGNEYLVEVLKDKKIGDTTKVTVAANLLEFNHAGTDAVIELARESLKSDVTKKLRYALGKEFAKYGRPEFEEICSEYIASEDVATQGTGLDIWAKGRYEGNRASVELIAADAEEKEEPSAENKKTYQFGVKKKNANAKKAKRILEQSASKPVDAVSHADENISAGSKTSSDVNAAPAAEKETAPADNAVSADNSVSVDNVASESETSAAVESGSVVEQASETETVSASEAAK